MPRTYLIKKTDKTVIVDPAHTNFALNQALLDAGVIEHRFSFDLLSELNKITTVPLLDDVMSSMAWYADVLIQNEVRSALADFYRVTKAGGEAQAQAEHEAEAKSELPSFSDYDTFVKYVEGLQIGEEGLTELGFDVRERIDTIRRLISFRTEVHAMIEKNPDLTRSRGPNLVNSVYFVPSLDRLFDEPPKLQKISARDEKTFSDVADDELARTTITDVDKRKLFREQYIEQQRYDAEVAKLNTYSWDQRKAAALRQLWVCISATAGFAEDEGDGVKTFLDLDTQSQYKLLTRAEAAMSKARSFLLTGNKLKAFEKAAMRVEVIEFLKSIDAAVKHERFADM